MTRLRTVLERLIGVAALLAFALSLGAPLAAASASPVGQDEAMVAVAAGGEPCLSHGAPGRCEAKALPLAATAAPSPREADGPTWTDRDRVARGVPPEVEPDPPRA